MNMREEFIKRLEDDEGVYAALVGLHDEHPKAFVRWLDTEDEDWLLQNNVALVKENGKVVACYPCKDGTIAGFILEIRRHSGKICTCCGMIDKVVNVEALYLSKADKSDGVMYNIDINYAAQKYAGEYWCEDCVRMYFEK